MYMQTKGSLSELLYLTVDFTSYVHYYIQVGVYLKHGYAQKVDIDELMSKESRSLT